MVNLRATPPLGESDARHKILFGDGDLHGVVIDELVRIAQLNERARFAVVAPSSERLPMLADEICNSFAWADKVLRIGGSGHLERVHIGFRDVAMGFVFCTVAPAPSAWFSTLLLTAVWNVDGVTLEAFPQVISQVGTFPLPTDGGCIGGCLISSDLSSYDCARLLRSDPAYSLHKEVLDHEP